jgi:hypothetical protein
MLTLCHKTYKGHNIITRHPPAHHLLSDVTDPSSYVQHCVKTLPQNLIFFKKYFTTCFGLYGHHHVSSATETTVLQAVIQPNSIKCMGSHKKSNNSFHTTRAVTYDNGLSFIRYTAQTEVERRSLILSAIFHKFSAFS